MVKGDYFHPHTPGMNPYANHYASLRGNDRRDPGSLIRPETFPPAQQPTIEREVEWENFRPLVVGIRA